MSRKQQPSNIQKEQRHKRILFHFIDSILTVLGCKILKKKWAWGLNIFFLIKYKHEKGIRLRKNEK